MDEGDKSWPVGAGNTDKTTSSDSLVIRNIWGMAWRGRGEEEGILEAVSKQIPEMAITFKCA